MNLLVCLFLGVVSMELGLNTLGTLHGVDDRREVNQEAIAHDLDNGAVMLADSAPDDLVMSLQRTQHTGFIAPHLTAEAHYVGEHDGRQPASFSRSRAVGFFPHGGDYAARARILSNCWFLF